MKFCKILSVCLSIVMLLSVGGLFASAAATEPAFIYEDVCYFVFPCEGDELDGTYTYGVYILDGITYTVALTLSETELVALTEDAVLCSCTLTEDDVNSRGNYFKYVYHCAKLYCDASGEVPLNSDMAAVVIAYKNGEAVAVDVWNYEYYMDDEPVVYVSNYDNDTQSWIYTHSGWTDYEAPATPADDDDEPVVPGVSSSGPCPMCGITTGNWFGDTVLLRFHYLVHIFWGIFKSFGLV